MTSENGRACPHCGSRKRKKDVLGDNSTFEVMRVEKPLIKPLNFKHETEVVIRLVVCAECGTVYDAVKEAVR